MTGVSIVIPTWNGRRLLEEFLPTVVAAGHRFATATAEPVEIVIVDDGSTDDTGTWISGQNVATAVPLRLVRLDANQGFAAACNAGAAAAAYSRMLLLNNDLAVNESAIPPLVAQLDAGSDLGPMFAVHCRMQDFASGEDVGTGKVGGYSRGFLRVHRSYVAREPARRPLPSLFASGGGSIFDRRRFLEIGGFDRLFAPFYFEDVELSYRAWKRGWVVAYEPAAFVRHRFSSTISAFGRRRIELVSHRNRLLFHWIHLDDRRWQWGHAAWISGLAIWSLVSFRPTFLRALMAALGRWPEVRRRRRELGGVATRGDREVLAIFRTLESRPDVVAYDTREELSRLEGRARR